MQTIDIATRMLILLALLVVIPGPGTLAAQDVPRDAAGTAVVLGTVVAETGDPVASVTVELRLAADSSIVAQTLTNADGQFRIAHLREGLYHVRLVSVGYGVVLTQTFELADDETRNLGTLRVSVEAVALEPIEVSAERTAVTFEADRTSYNLGVMGTEGRSVTDLPQGRSDARYAGDLGIRYQFLDDRASIRLSLEDPFGLRETSSRLQDLTYIQIGRSRESTRSAQVSMSWSLGGGGRRGGGRDR